jgi:hypothetical protein
MIRSMARQEQDRHDPPRQQRPPDEELKMLLQELRVSLPGVQVLFAFLLTVPFNQRFKELDPVDTAVFVLGVLAAALAAVLYIAPSAAHRVLWPDTAADEEALVRRSNQQAIGAHVFLGLAMVTSVFVVVDFIFGRLPALTVGVVLIVLIGLLWFRAPRRSTRSR